MKKIYSISTVAIVGLALASSAKAVTTAGYDNLFPVLPSSLAANPGTYDTDGPEYYVIYNGSTATVVNSDQMAGLGYSGTFATSDQGPFDASDDTYIGVINTSRSTTLNSLHLANSSPSYLDIFGFDGDGIDVAAADAGLTVGATGDTTGYGGPLGVFSGITGPVGFGGASETGTISFNGGVAPGGTTYFSLEEAINSAGGSGTGLQTTVPDAGSSMMMLGGALAGIAGLRRRLSK